MDHDLASSPVTDLDAAVAADAAALAADVDFANSFARHGMDLREWQKSIAHYTVPDERRSWLQMANSLIPYIALWALVPLAAHHLWSLALVTLGLTALLVRMFSLMHELAHRALFHHPKTNDAIGTLFGLLTFTSMHSWRRDHAIHHATTGNLDKRGRWEIVTWTVEEYRSRSTLRRLGYRIYRSPVFLLGIAPTLSFLVDRRVPRDDATRRTRTNVYVTNLWMAAEIVAFGFLFGWKLSLGIHMAMIMLAGAIGSMLLFVQHQYEETYHQAPELWDYTASALQGSSYLKLPRPLRWLLADAGYHHVHHLVPKVPNYYLAKLHDENPIFHETPVITLWGACGCYRYNLWCAERKRLVRFRDR